jgi:WD40 repeat protein
MPREAHAQEERKIEIIPQSGRLPWITSVAISPDGKTVLSSSWDKTLKLWDLATGRLSHSLEGHSRPVTSVVVSSVGITTLSLSDDGATLLWDLATCRRMCVVQEKLSVRLRSRLTGRPHCWAVRTAR